MIPSGTINTWDLLEKAFIQRYCPHFKTAKQLEEIHNFKQKGDESMYQAWERRTNNGSSDGIAAITSKLDSLGRDMKKLKENAHAIQVGCGIYGGTHLDKEFPLNEEVKGVEEVKYGEFRRSFPNNGGNGTRYRMGPPRYYTCMENRPPFGEKKPSLEELINKHIEESTGKRTETKDWMKKLQENTYMNIRNQNAALKNLETQIEQLTKDFQAKAAKEAPNTLTPISHCKAIFAENDAQSFGTCSNDTNKFHGVSFISNYDVQEPLTWRKGKTKIAEPGMRRDIKCEDMEFCDYLQISSEFENEIMQLENEYKLRIGKKGYILDDILEKCEHVYGGTLES
ncbi:hypothetical protein Tco_0846163 [Tanacetum coccineum]